MGDIVGLMAIIAIGIAVVTYTVITLVHLCDGSEEWGDSGPIQE